MHTRYLFRLFQHLIPVATQYLLLAVDLAISGMWVAVTFGLGDVLSPCKAWCEFFISTRKSRRIMECCIGTDKQDIVLVLRVVATPTADPRCQEDRDHHLAASLQPLTTFRTRDQCMVRRQ
ncbi:hypothetical protein EDD85DRAFT_818404 [Armillaria nabsnona]|nr:hypothetical protein EDD85DRAFT_818404 [Armillaria nabsnona]